MSETLPPPSAASAQRPKTTGTTIAECHVDRASQAERIEDDSRRTGIAPTAM
jgi:hypothetical protein